MDWLSDDYPTFPQFVEMLKDYERRPVPRKPQPPDYAPSHAVHVWEQQRTVRIARLDPDPSLCVFLGQTEPIENVVRLQPKR